MRSAVLAIFFAFMATVFARPQGDWSGWPQNGTQDADEYRPGHSKGNGTYGHGWGYSKDCLDDTDVQTLVAGYTYLLQSPGGPDFNKTANSILSGDKFMVWSDSINTLNNRPFGTPAYSSLHVFLATQAQTPPLPTVQTLSTFYTCNQISWRWNASGIGSNKVSVQGMISFDVNVATKQINTVYSEFNTAAFWTDLSNPECKGN